MYCKPIPITEWKTIKRGPYRVIVAKTPCEKQQGLQGAKKLPRKTILFFMGIRPNIFFHTRNCQFPIDIIPLTSGGRVLSIWGAYPGANFIGPTPPGTFNVVEAPLGWAEKNKIKVGDVLSMFAVGYCFK